MIFLIKEKIKRRSFFVIFNEKDRCFDIEPFEQNHNNFTSLEIGFLQIGIDFDKRLTYVWGYEPLIKYSETNKFPSAYEDRDLVAVIERELIPGVSIELDKEKDWPTYINKDMGWVCIGDPTIEERRLIKFASDSIATLNNESEMVAIWLHPKELPSHILKKKN